MDIDGQKLGTDLPEGRSNRNTCTEGRLGSVGWSMGCTGSGQRAVFRANLNATSPGVSTRSVGIWEP